MQKICIDLLVLQGSKFCAKSRAVSLNPDYAKYCVGGQRMSFKDCQMTIFDTWAARLRIRRILLELGPGPSAGAGADANVGSVFVDNDPPRLHSVDRP
jgi:hypothetical protein